MFPILYSFRRCPYAMRARLAIRVAAIQVELREVVLKHKPAQLLSASPKGTVPVLVLPDGCVIDESRDIMDWALQQYDPQNWLAYSATELNALIDENDRHFKPNLDGYKYADRHPQPASFYRLQAEAFLQQLEARLKPQRYLLGDNISLADMAILPFIRQFAHVDLDWFNRAPYPNVQQWLHDFLEGEEFAAVMKKYPAWQPDQTPQLFPTL